MSANIVSPPTHGLWGVLDLNTVYRNKQTIFQLVVEIYILLLRTNNDNMKLSMITGLYYTKLQMKLGEFKILNILYISFVKAL